MATTIIAILIGRELTVADNPPRTAVSTARATAARPEFFALPADTLLPGFS